MSTKTKALQEQETKRAPKGKVSTRNAETANSLEKSERVKSEFAKAMENAERRAADLTAEKVANLYSSYLQVAIFEAAASLQASGFTSEAQKAERIAREGFEATNGFRVRYSDTENGITESPANGLHEMWRAATQSLLKVLAAERDAKREAEEKRKAEVLQAVSTLSPEMLAILKANGLRI